jgi:tRNA(Arg) A34 adenosine deaminase TadA
MCLGAILWSGVERLLCSAAGEDARRLGFEEGPVFPESFGYLAGRGIAIVRGIRGDEGRRVLELYRERGGPIYNG